MNTNKNAKSTNDKNDNRTRMSNDDKGRSSSSSKITRMSANSDNDDEKTTRNSSKSNSAKDTDSKSQSSTSARSARMSANSNSNDKKGAQNSTYSGNDTDRSDNKTYAKSAQSEFHKFFVDAVKDIYWAEQHLTKGLRKMSKAATSPKLAAAFDKHIAESDKQMAVIEQVFELLGEKPATKRCAAMAGLLEEAESAISDTEKNSFVRDAALIMASQKAEHYEIATYGTLAALAEYLSEKKVAKLLSKILVGEKKTDGSLTKLAEDFINECAAVE